VDAFTEPVGLIETPLRIVFSRMIIPAKEPAHNRSKGLLTTILENTTTEKQLN
jgi:hypothetical protein